MIQSTHDSNVSKFQAQTIELLGGDEFLTSDFYKLHFKASIGTSFWQAIKNAIWFSLELMSDSEMRRKGQFPEIFMQTVSQISAERAQPEAKLSLVETQEVTKLLKQKYFIETGQGEPLWQKQIHLQTSSECFLTRDILSLSSFFSH